MRTKEQQTPEWQTRRAAADAAFYRARYLRGEAAVVEILAAEAARAAYQQQRANDAEHARALAALLAARAAD